MRKFITLFAELTLIMSAIFIADFWQSKSNIIPRNLIHLPQVDYSSNDFWMVLKYFLVIHLLIFASIQFRNGAVKFSIGQRLSKEIFTLIAAYSISALTIFITTTVNYDPDFIAGIGICSVLLFVITHYLAKSLTPQQAGNSSLVNSLIRQFFSISGVFVLILALTPPVLAYFFTKSRDVANVITQIRINANDLLSEKANYRLVNIKEGMKFQQPLLAKTAPRNDQILYILERPGRLMSLEYPPSATTATKLVIDFQNKVGEAEIENGALGFAFHPEFGDRSSKNSGFIYIYYTDVHNDEQINKVSRFNLNLSSPTSVNQSETTLLALKRENSGFHNGGSIEFGADGFLYIALGEGVHLKESSIAKTLRQGILRVDVDQLGGSISQPVLVQPVNGVAKNYYIPKNNPFVNSSDIRDEYWAIGLRNPYRFNFDPKTGFLWVGDVGSTKWEEINIIKKGGDYQFPAIEGREETGIGKPFLPVNAQHGPIYTYLHTAYDRAVIGGNVYQGTTFPELQGSYIFADNYSSKLFKMPSDKKIVDHVTQIAKANQFAQRGVSSVNILNNGDILVTTLGRSVAPTGEVLQLIDADKTEMTINKTPEKTEVLKVTKAEALRIFVTNCARCHGTNGKADGPDSAILGTKVADFTHKTFQSTRSNEHLLNTIRKGGVANGLSPMMPPWEGILDKEEIEALVTTIREFKTDN